MAATVLKGLLGTDNLHARVEDLKRTKGPAAGRPRTERPLIR